METIEIKMGVHDISLTLTVQNTGETFEVEGDDLISLESPLSPPYLNRLHHPGLRARNWRHDYTKWYDNEHSFLSQLHETYPMCADAARVLLYAVYVVCSDGKLYKGSNDTFREAYEKFRKLHGTSPPLLLNMPIRAASSPEDYLQHIYPQSYFQWKTLFRAWWYKN